MNNKPLFFLDTNIFIYYFHDVNEFSIKAKKIFEQLVSDSALGMTSVITQTELLSIKMTEKESHTLLAYFLETPNLKIKNITQEIAIKAAQLRRIYGMRTSDAIQLATAIVNKADFFITNDKQLKKCREIKIKLF